MHAQLRTSSQVSFTGDDFLNIHNRMVLICEQTSASSLALIDVDGSTLTELQPEDRLRFYQLNTMAPLGAASVVAKTQVTNATNATQLARCADAWAAMQAPPYARQPHCTRPLGEVGEVETTIAIRPFRARQV